VFCLFNVNSFNIFVKQNRETMKDIICVDLTILNDAELKDFCATYDLMYETILGFRTKTYAKLWLTKDGILIAFDLIKENDFEIEDYGTIRLFNKFLPELSNIKVYAPIKEPIILEVDIILEKIFKYGKDVLTIEEKNFLDNQ
jgi:hypothetical protein